MYGNKTKTIIINEGQPSSINKKFLNYEEIFSNSANDAGMQRYGVGGRGKRLARP